MKATTKKKEPHPALKFYKKEVTLLLQAVGCEAVEGNKFPKLDLKGFSTITIGGALEVAKKKAEECSDELFMNYFKALFGTVVYLVETAKLLEDGIIHQTEGKVHMDRHKAHVGIGKDDKKGTWENNNINSSSSSRQRVYNSSAYLTKASKMGLLHPSSELLVIFYCLFHALELALLTSFFLTVV